MKAKKILKEILTDPKHWVGWVLSVLAIYFALTFFHYYLDWFKGIVVFLVIVIVDSFKHITYLQ